MRAVITFLFLSGVGLVVIGTAFGQGNKGAMVASSPVSPENPAMIIQRASTQFIEALNRHEAQIKKNPQEIDKLVHKYLLPHFDLSFTTRLVLGHYWSVSTPAQRKAFSQAFIHYLLAVYAKGIASYHSAKVQVLPLQGGASRQFVSVATLVQVPNSQPVAVDYAMHRVFGSWKIFDVKVMGISFVLTYRDQYQDEIKQTSLTALIKRLQHVQSPKSVTVLAAATSG
ncbi:MAG: ABC transporter substrate-binding protein [Gammaproteobacteria bacterium]